MRHSQTAVFIVTYESKALNFIPTFPNEAIDSRVDKLNYIFCKGNERGTKHKLGYDKCLHDLNFPIYSEVSPFPSFHRFR